VATTGRYFRLSRARIADQDSFAATVLLLVFRRHLVGTPARARYSAMSEINARLTGAQGGAAIRARLATFRSDAAGWLVLPGWVAVATSGACSRPKRRGSKMFLAA
jgi:hypothetical protein